MSVATVVELQFEDDANADGWGGLPPGPELGALLASVEPAGLPDDELMAVMAAWRRQAAWANAGELAAVAELVARRDVENAHVRDQFKVGEFVADEVSLALTVTGRAAGALLSLAVALTGRLPITWGMLKAGRIDVPRARVLADALLGVSNDVAAAVERVVLPEAERLTTGRLRHRVRQAICEVDPDAAEERRKRAVRGRRLELTDTPSGTCDLAGRDLPVDEADAAFNRINAAALGMQTDGDERPIDAIRADLFTALLRGVALPVAAKDLALSSGPDEVATPGGRFDAKPSTAGNEHRVADPDAIAALTGEVAGLVADLTHAHLASVARGGERGARSLLTPRRSPWPRRSRTSRLAGAQRSMGRSPMPRGDTATVGIGQRLRCVASLFRIMGGVRSRPAATKRVVAISIIRRLGRSSGRRAGAI